MRGREEARACVRGNARDAAPNTAGEPNVSVRRDIMCKFV